MSSTPLDGSHPALCELLCSPPISRELGCAPRSSPLYPYYCLIDYGLPTSLSPLLCLASSAVISEYLRNLQNFPMLVGNGKMECFPFKICSRSEVVVPCSVSSLSFYSVLFRDFINSVLKVIWNIFRVRLLDSYSDCIVLFNI